MVCPNDVSAQEQWNSTHMCGPETSAPEIFHREMTELFQQLEGVVAYMDNILVLGSTEEEHNKCVMKTNQGCRPKAQQRKMSAAPETAAPLSTLHWCAWHEPRSKKGKSHCRNPATQVCTWVKKDLGSNALFKKIFIELDRHHTPPKLNFEEWRYLELEFSAAAAFTEVKPLIFKPPYLLSMMPRHLQQLA